MKLDYEVCALVITSMLILVSARQTDRPCSSKSVRNRSVLCVCTAKYCDTLTRETPTLLKSFIYTTSEAGLRFKKISEPVQPMDEDADSDIILELDPMVQFQTIEGFGGAVTDATGINWKELRNDQLMDHLIQSYCGSKGIEYNMLRVPIGGTDFSTRAYAYNEYPQEDIHLSNFTLVQEDYDYKLPMIRACMSAARQRVSVLASTWSSPPWMKTTNNYLGYSIKKEHLPTYANYHYKFIESYANQGVPVWGLTTTNEPLSNSNNYIDFKNMGWTPDYLNELIVNNLGPTLRNSPYKDVKLIVGDDQRMAQYWDTLVNTFPETMSFLAGIATYFNMDKHTSASPLAQRMYDSFPNKFVITTVAASGDQDAVDLGSWEKAELYVDNIMESLNNNAVGVIDWNMALNTQGGPSWINAKVDAPIIINPHAREFYKQPTYYAIGHFSKFIPRGSKRIQHRLTGVPSPNLQAVAFLTPMNTIVTVISNRGRHDEVRLRYGNNEVEVPIKAKSITTVEVPHV